MVPDAGDNLRLNEKARRWTPHTESPPRPSTPTFQPQQRAYDNSSFREPARYETRRPSTSYRDAPTFCPQRQAYDNSSSAEPARYGTRRPFTGERTPPPPRREYDTRRTPRPKDVIPAQGHEIIGLRATVVVKLGTLPQSAEAGRNTQTTMGGKIESRHPLHLGANMQ